MLRFYLAGTQLGSILFLITTLFGIIDATDSLLTMVLLIVLYVGFLIPILTMTLCVNLIQGYKDYVRVLDK